MFVNKGVGMRARWTSNMGMSWPGQVGSRPTFGAILIFNVGKTDIQSFF